MENVRFVSATVQLLCNVGVDFALLSPEVCVCACPLYDRHQGINAAASSQLCGLG